MDPVQDNIHLGGIADPVSAGTHLLAFFATIAGYKSLLRRTAARPYERRVVTVFCVSTAIQYLASFAYHTVHDPTLRKIDHATIYVLIAGCYTALCGAQLAPHLRWPVHATIWTFGLAGIVHKVFFFDFTSETWDTAFFLIAGWIGSVPTYVIWRRGDRGTTAWILLGAILYTVGALFELYGWPLIVPRVFNFHEVFHLCVMAASVVFYISVWRTILPPDDEGFSGPRT